MEKILQQRFANALARLAGDKDMLKELSMIVSEDAPGHLNVIERGISQRDIGAIYRSAHALKGLLSTFETGEPVSDLDAVIEAARAGDEYVAEVLFRSLHDDLACLISTVKQFAES